MTPSHPDQPFRSVTTALLEQALLHAELIKVEWAEEKCRLLRMLITLLAGTVCLFMGLLSISALVLIFSWDTSYRNAALFVLTGCYCLGAVAAGYRFRALARLGELAFADSRSEIGADLALFRHKLSE